jgi:hypothetical protein
MRKPNTKFNEKSARTAAAWVVKVLNIEDWIVNFVFSDDPPDWADAENTMVVGSCSTHRRKKEAIVWVSPGRCRDTDTPWICAIMHEMWHVAMADLGIEGPDAEAFMPSYESLWDRLDGVLEAAYLMGYRPEP